MKKISKIFIVMCVMSITMSKAFAQIDVGISVGIAPPELPVYVQPPCPVDDYIWQPGYWAYDPDDGYYWVPGVWVAAPEPGYLWTPSYWGYDGGHYGYHGGYWGTQVGFYGGINYGFGYGGFGFGGGMWSGGHFRYNTAVVNVNRTVIHNTYINRSVINNRYVNNHTSFNGPGGVDVKPRPEERAAMNERHIQPTSQQMSHQQTASHNKTQFASVNHGHPTAVAMNKVGGRPFTAQGHVAKNTSFGHSTPAVNATPARQSTISHPAKSARSFSPRAASPQQQRAQAPRPEQQQRAQAPRPQQQQRAQAPRPQEQQQQRAQAPRPQQQQQQRAQAPRPQQQQQQRAQAPRPQQQQQQRPQAPRPQQQQQQRPQAPRPQQQNSPRPAQGQRKH